MVLEVNDANCRMSHSCTIFKDPDIISREVCYCGILLRSWYNFCGNVSQCAHNSDTVRMWIFWDVMLCHSVSSSCGFGGSCHLQSAGNQPCRDTELTTWKSWILINTTVRTLGVMCHNVACPHVACTVQATQWHMHWMVLTHSLVNLDQCPFDFIVFSPFKKAPDICQMKSERCWSNSDRSPRRIFWRRSVDWCVKGIVISAVMELFLMVFPSLSGWGVTLTLHPLLVPWWRKGRAIPLLPLWAIQPVQNLTAYTRVHFTFSFSPFRICLE